MTKRKARKIVPKKRSLPKLDTEFDCPFCCNTKCIHVKLNLKSRTGTLWCTVCAVHYASSSLTRISESVDLYSEWIDACVEVNNESSSVSKGTTNNYNHGEYQAASLEQNHYLSDEESAVSNDWDNTDRPASEPLSHPEKIVQNYNCDSATTSSGGVVRRRIEKLVPAADSDSLNNKNKSAHQVMTEYDWKSVLESAKTNDWEAVISVLENLDSELKDNKDSYLQSEVVKLSLTQDLRSGNTIGHIAAAANNVTVLKILFGLGVDLRRSNFSLKSPMEIARKKGDESKEAVEFILTNVYSPVEALFYGVDTYEALVKMFTQFPEAINDTLECYNGMSWACLCVEEARVQELRWLFLHGADFTVTDEGGNTLLHMIPIPYDSSGEDNEDDLSSSCSSPDNEESDELQGKTNKTVDVTCNNDCSTTHVVQKNNIEKDGISQHDILSSIESNENDALSKRLSEKTPEETDLLDILGYIDDFTSDGIKTLETLAYLLSLKIFDLNCRNNTGSTPAHLIAEKSSNSPKLAWYALQLLNHCGGDLNSQDDDGSNVAMVMAGSSGDGPWLTWVLSPKECGGGGCDPNQINVQGRKVEDLIVGANLETFDSELDIDEHSYDNSDDSDFIQSY